MIGNTQVLFLENIVGFYFLEVTMKHFTHWSDVEAMKNVKDAYKALDALMNYGTENVDSYLNTYVLGKYKEDKQDLIISFLLINATQNIRYVDLIPCYHVIKGYLPGKELHPAFVGLITEHRVHLPQDTTVYNLRMWLELRKEIMKNDARLAGCFYDDRFLLCLSDKIAREHLKRCYASRGCKRPLKGMFPIKRMENGKPLCGAKVVLCETSRVLHKTYIDIEAMGYDFTLDDMMESVGEMFDVDLSNYSQNHQSSKHTKWVQEMKNNVANCVKNCDNVFLYLIIYTLSMPC